VAADLADASQRPPTPTYCESEPGGGFTFNPSRIKALTYHGAGESLRTGQEVSVFGLLLQRELNGCHGVVLRGEVDGRVLLQLTLKDGVAKTVVLRTVNLHVCPPDEARLTSLRTGASEHACSTPGEGDGQGGSVSSEPPRPAVARADSYREPSFSEPSVRRSEFGRAKM
jgi:hypothetical protein